MSIFVLIIILLSLISCVGVIVWDYMKMKKANKQDLEDFDLETDRIQWCARKHNKAYRGTRTWVY